MGADQEPVWASGDSYEPYVGRWSRLVARDFLDWLAVPRDARWLDVGCGTGAVTSGILSRAFPASVLGVDPSPQFVEHARATIHDGRATFQIGDAQTLPAAPKTFDAVVSGLVLNFVPDTGRAVGEMRRVARRGAVIGVYVWDYAGKMELMRYFWDAAGDLDPVAREQDEGRRFPLCRPEALTATFQRAGLDAIETRAIDAPTVFRDFDDYWTPFLGGQAPAPGYCMSLSEERRAVLRDTIRGRLPFAVDGTIPLVARAWAVKATVPG
jgi:SAM-dependent methyltransferase